MDILIKSSFSKKKSELVNCLEILNFSKYVSTVLVDITFQKQETKCRQRMPVTF